MMRLNKGLIAVAAVGCLFGLAPVLRAGDLSSRPAGAMDLAQNYMPPDDVGGGEAPRGRASDEASLLIRVERLESQVRQLNGQIEQMQFANRQLQEQLRKFQQDVEFRFQDSSGRPKGSQKRGELEGAGATQTAAAGDDPVVTNTPSPATRGGRRGDAFDPSADPDAPGVPHALGGGPAVINSASSAGPSNHDIIDESDPGAPLQLSSSPERSRAPAAREASINPPSAAPQAGLPSSTGPLTTAGGTIIANVQPNAQAVNTVKEEFDLALGYMKQKEYEAAEKSFSAFLQKNPKTRYSAEAIYYLGESYYLRGRQREAAEQYLLISKNYANSSRAPEALLRLGQSLNALGAKEQACASFTEVGRKYPNAPASVKAQAEREAKRVQC